MNRLRSRAASALCLLLVAGALTAVACGGRKGYDPNSTHGWVLRTDGAVTECPRMKYVASENRSPYIWCRSVDDTAQQLITTWQEYVFSDFGNPWANK